MTMPDHEDIETDAGRDPERMSADERRAELACILARGLRGLIAEQQLDFGAGLPRSGNDDRAANTPLPAGCAK